MEQGQIIKLENDKEYIVAKSIVKGGINYYYLMTSTKPIEVMFVKELIENNESSLEELDIDELNEVMELFGE